MRTRTRLALGTMLTLTLSLATDGFAQNRPIDLVGASLEDLMRIEITSAGRREQSAEDVPAAIFVLTSDDIRRSGIQSLPELFRLVPGMQVGRINGNKWAVSARGFNDLFADKLLVLIDGRTIYKRTFSGVFWHAEDLMLEDIERIEVIRGAGGTMWGANAVNGVINIITKSAADTQGTLVRAGAGTSTASDGAARYGGSLGALKYRVFGLWQDSRGGQFEDGTSAHDDWHTAKVGFRTDWSGRAQSAAIEGNVLDGQQHGLWGDLSPIPGAPQTVDSYLSTASSADVLGRWTASWASGSFLQVQSFFARQELHDPGESEVETVGDVDIEYHSKVGRRQDLVMGGGYRTASRSDDGGSFGFSVRPSRSRQRVVNLFLQDELAFGRQVTLAVGSKVEHRTAAGWGLQPSARLMWHVPGDRQHVWAAVSRALRTPSPKDLGSRTNFAYFIGPQGVPVLLGVVGSPDFKTEESLDTEAGYRVSVSSKASVDVTAFRGHYSNLRTVEPMPPVFETSPGGPHLFVPIQYQNLLDADTTGFEVTARLAPTEGWRLDGSYSAFHLSPHPDAASRDAAAATFDGNAPAHSWQLHSSVWVGRRTELNASLFQVGRLRELDIPAYTRVDARVEVKLAKSLSLIASGQNLGPAHPEFTNVAVASTVVRASGHLQLVCRF